MDWVQTAAIVFSLVIAFAALTASRGEAALRMRPWVGITGVQCGPPVEAAPQGIFGTITVNYDNLGAVPAESITITLQVQPLRLRLTPAYYGVLFPHEPSDQRFGIGAAEVGRIVAWLDQNPVVRLRGTITYGFGTKKRWLGLWGERTRWRTTFEACMRPGDQAAFHAHDDVLLKQWSNVSTTAL